MSETENRSPTLDDFLAFGRRELSFLTDELGFGEEALPSETWVNPYQLRFASSKVRVIVEGINWGFAAAVSISPLARPTITIPAHWLVPAGEEAPTPPSHVVSSQLRDVYVGAQCLRRWGSTALTGELASLEARFDRMIRVVRHRSTDAEAAERAFASSVTEAGHAFKRGEYARVVELLSPHSGRLSRHQSQMLEYAREHV